MKTFTQVVRLSLIALIGFLGQTAQGQTMNPNDSVITYNPAKPPTLPTGNKIGKWVRTVRLNWNTNEYKCYIYQGVPYRLKFPKSYNPTANDGKIYPVLVFYHGLGEAGPQTDNELSLYHGGQGFMQNVDNGTFDGYILVPQTQGGWGPYSTVRDILDSLITYNKADPFHIVNNGLSAGGQGVWQMYINYPTYICYINPMSAVFVQYADTAFVNSVKYTPIWELHGGLDGDPTPQAAAQVFAAMQAGGANYQDKNYTTLGHDTWDSTWLEPSFYPRINAAYMSNPWPLFGKTQFCPGDNINVTVGLVAGFTAYQWRLNGNVIPGATGHTIQATQAGTYDARVEKGTVWSDWSHTPVQIVIQSPTVTPPIQVSGLMSPVIPAADGNTSVNLTVPNSNNYTSFIWEKVGSSTVLGTSPVFAAASPGNYNVSVNTQFGCSSIFSPPFTVVNANGSNGPSPVGNLVANSNSNTKVALSWSLSPNQANPATSFEVYRGTKKGGPYVLDALLSPVTVSYTDTLLSPAVQYFYVIRAVNGNAASALCNEANATTLSDLTPPTVPGGLTVTSTTSSSITLSWTASTDNVGVTQYDLYINGVKSYITSQTTFIASGLTHDQTYTFTVKAEDGSGNISPASNQVSGTAIISGLTYQYYDNLSTSMSVLPNFGTLTPASTGSMPNVSIAGAPDAVDFAYLWQGYITIPTTGTYFFQTSSDDGSRLWLGARNGTTSPYTFSGTPTVNNDALQGTTSKNSAALSLTAGTYPIAIGYFQQGGGAAMSVAWRTPSSGTTYVAIPNSAFTETVTLGAVPAIPTAIHATAVSYNSISVTWTDNSSNETGFEIYRSTSASGPFSIITTSAANTTSYTDATGAASTTYYYKVQAINNNGASGFDPASIGGVTYSFYSDPSIGTWSNMSKLGTLTPVATGSATNISLSVVPSNITTNYALKFQGTIKISTAGLYTFFTSSDDGSDLYVGGFDSTHLVVKNDFLQGTTQRSGTVNLAIGSYPIFVTYFQQGGGVALTASYTKPGGSQVTIPDSVLINAFWSATTLALPAAPTAPTSFTGSSLSPSVVQLGWQDAAPTVTGFGLYRSFGDSLHFQLLATLPVTGSFKDSSLFGHSLYYYKVQALGVGGNSAFTNALAVTTKDNAPVVSSAPNLSVRYTTTANVAFQANDADGDAMSYSGVNLPGFATLTDNGNGTATLTLSPAVSDAGIYTGIGVSVTDHSGGVTNSVFNVNVNGNFPPVINPVADYQATTGTLLSIPITGSDANPADILSFSVSGAPSNYTLAAGPNGSDTLKITPSPASKGLYTVYATVTDATGGIANDTFHVNVTYVDPSQHIYIRPSAGDAIGAPWNSLTGTTASNLLDANGNTTNVGISFNPWWWFASYPGGQSTGNNSGIYPDAVLKDYFYWGINGGPDTAMMSVIGLDTTKTYSLTLLGSATGANYLGTVLYIVNNQTQTLIVENNTQGVVTFNSIQPASDGSILIKMAKGTGVQEGYWNSLVISSSFNDGTAPLTPTGLTVQNISGHGVQLNWQAPAYNAKSYQVYRATTAAGPFALINTIQLPNAVTYLDSPVNGNVTYYYTVNAINSNGVSGNSDTATITTLDRIPVINPIGNASLKGGQTLSINVVAVDDPADHITLTATGLPAYASLVDNGNGTGTISVTPGTGIVGLSQITVTATDLSDSSSSVSFSLSVVDKDVASIYLNFTSGPIAPAPWNTIQSGGTTAPGFSYTNFTDDGGNPTTVALTLLNGFTYSVQYGMRKGNGNGIYPDLVLRNNFFESSSRADSVKVSGLNPAKMYNFVFFASHDDGIASITHFSIGSQSTVVDASYNTNKTVSINGLKSDANGNIVFSVQKDATANWCFLNALVIQSYDPTVPLLAPSDLRVIATKTNSITLQWADRSANETGFELWRSVNGGSYSLLKTLGANVVTYKDSILTPNNTYFYIVRSITASLKSNFTSAVTSTTYAYAVDVNVTDDNIPTAPWNNLDAPAQPGQVWNNFFDESGKTTSMTFLLNGAYAGGQPEGMVTGNNSGIYPDAVLAKEYITFPGQTGGFNLSGLDVNMKYDVTLMPSVNIFADNTTYYAVGTDTVIQSGTLNINHPATLYGLSPDSKGTIQVWLGLYGASEEGVINAILIQGYNQSTIGSPSAPVGQGGADAAQTMTQAASIVTTIQTNGDSVVLAFPNPFRSSFTLEVPAQQNDRVQVLIYDVSGATVYQKEFDNMNQGTNYLNITPSWATKTGTYLVRLVSSDGQSKYKTIKVVQMK